MGSICHWYMCIVLYMKLISCNGFPGIYASLEEGVGVNLPWVYVHSAIYETIWCNGLPWIYGQLEERMGPIDHRSMLHHYTP